MEREPNFFVIDEGERFSDVLFVLCADHRVRLALSCRRVLAAVLGVETLALAACFLPRHFCLVDVSDEKMGGGVAARAHVHLRFLHKKPLCFVVS